MNKNNPYRTLVIKEALNILSKEERYAFTARYLYGMNLQTISLALGYKESYVYSARIIDQAHLKLNELYENDNYSTL